ncbi:hypothetical protein [Paracoccus cavernae]|uniref:hypothetical protein n=1 Tax=Paracoccus cavernae TaxID=1571207 RepID=UPI0035F28183
MSAPLFGTGAEAQYTLFELRFGEVCGHLAMTNFDDVLANTPLNVALIEGHYPADEFILVDGVVTALPPKPGPGWVLNPETVEWIDMRDPEAEHEGRRAAASMSRSDFLLAAIRAGIIPPEDAGPAARGEIPPSMRGVFAGFPAELQLEAVVRWSGSVVIDRLNPVLLAIADGLGVDGAQLDALFGIAA